MTATTMLADSLLIVSCLVSARAVEVAVMAAMAARVIDARSLIVAIEREGSKPSFDALGQCNVAVQVDGPHNACEALPGLGVGGILVFACRQS
jgi:hypothetical protein